MRVTRIDDVTRYLIVSTVFFNDFGCYLYVLMATGGTAGWRLRNP